MRAIYWLVGLAGASAVLAASGADGLGFLDGLADFRYGKDVRLEHTAYDFIGRHRADAAALRAFAAEVRAEGERATTPDGRSLAAALLGLTGGDDDVPFLAGLLRSPSDFAAGATALSQLGTDAAVGALIDAYGAAGDDRQRLALIVNLGWSRSPKAAAFLATIAPTVPPVLVPAVAEALAATASPQALASFPEGDTALLIAARSLGRRGERDGAAVLIGQLLHSPRITPLLRASAVRAMLEFDLPGAEALLQSLSDDPAPEAQTLALDYFSRLPAARREAIVQSLQAAPDSPETYRRLLRVADSLPIAALLPLTASSDAGIRHLALLPLSLRPDRAGFDRAVREYLGADADRTPDWQAVLIAMPRSVDPWLAEALGAAPAAGQIKLCLVIKRRVAVGAEPALLRLAHSADPRLRRAALDALGAIGLSGPPDEALSLLTGATLPSERTAAAAVLRASYRRTTDPAAFVDGVVERLDTIAEGPAHEAVVAFLGETGEPAALAALWQAYDRGAAGLRAIVLRALENWPDAAPLDRLALAAKQEQEPRLRILALRDYLDVLARAPGLAPEDRLQDATRGLQLADRDEERLAALAVAAAIPGPEVESFFAAFERYPALAADLAAARTRQRQLLASARHSGRIGARGADPAEALMAGLAQTAAGDAQSARRIQARREFLTALSAGDLTPDQRLHYGWTGFILAENDAERGQVLAAAAMIPDARTRMLIGSFREYHGEYHGLRQAYAAADKANTLLLGAHVAAPAGKRVSPREIFGLNPFDAPYLFDHWSDPHGFVGRWGTGDTTIDVEAFPADNFRAELSRSGGAPVALVGFDRGSELLLLGPGLRGIIAHGQLTLTGTASPAQVLRRVPVGVTTFDRRPAGAQVLLDAGTGLRNFHRGRENARWKVLPDGSVEIDPRFGSIYSRGTYGDVRIYLEFRHAYNSESLGPRRGNSGLFVMNTYEVQIVDSFGEPPDSTSEGSIYNIYAPAVQASAPPLEWQSLEVEFHAPRFDDRGVEVVHGRMTVWQNGRMIQDNVELPHPTAASVASAARLKAPRPPQPFMLQDHGGLVQFRNIWVLPLAP